MIEISTADKDRDFPIIKNVEVDKFGIEIFFKFAWQCKKCKSENEKWVAGEMSHICVRGSNKIELQCPICKREWKARVVFKFDIKIKEC